MRRLLVTSLLAFFSIAAPLAQAEVIDIDNVELARLSQSGVPVIDMRGFKLLKWRFGGIAR